MYYRCLWDLKLAFNVSTFFWFSVKVDDLCREVCHFMLAKIGTLPSKFFEVTYFLSLIKYIHLYDIIGVMQCGDVLIHNVDGQARWRYMWFCQLFLLSLMSWSHVYFRRCWFWFWLQVVTNSKKPNQGGDLRGKINSNSPLTRENLRLEVLGEEVTHLSIWPELLHLMMDFRFYSINCIIDMIQLSKVFEEQTFNLLFFSSALWL